MPEIHLKPTRRGLDSLLKTEGFVFVFVYSGTRLVCCVDVGEIRKAVLF